MADSFESLDDRPWDAELAADLVGAVLLVGLTYLDFQDNVLERRQVFGRVTSCDPERGVVIRQDSAEDFTIAPVMDAIEAAEPGVYELSDGRTVENPDFVAMITVTQPARS